MEKYLDNKIKRCIISLLKIRKPKEKRTNKGNIKMKKTKKAKRYINQSIAIIIITISIIAGYIQLQKEDKLSEYAPNNIIQTNIINDVTEISKANIPEYSGQIVISINNNVPYFEENDINTEEFENYSNLDEIGRAGVAFANICKYTMPPEGTKRSSLSYKPTGWNQYLYGENNSKHLYERCHLIAWQLGNENNNKKNLITGTCMLNESMIEYENIVANWIKQKNKENKDYHVLYRVTPIYKEDNKLATGVEIEAKSVEEEGISFNKFIYNIEKNFDIDYNTGKAELKENN